MSDERALTIRQPYASLIVAGVKDVENRSWPVPSTLPQWQKCLCGHRLPRQVDNGGTCNWRNVGPFPFRLWVHAGKGIDYAAFTQHPDIKRLWARPRYPAGVLLGSVLVTGCHHADECCHLIRGDFDPTRRVFGHCSRWAEPDTYHWTLADPLPLPEPIPMKGRQGLWRLPDDVAVSA